MFVDILIYLIINKNLYYRYVERFNCLYTFAEFIEFIDLCVVELRDINIIYMFKFIQSK